MKSLLSFFLFALSLAAQYSPPVGGGNSGGAPSGSVDSIQTKAGPTTFGNAGIATSGGRVVFGSAGALASGYQFQYSQQTSDASSFGGFLGNMVGVDYTGSVALSSGLDGLDIYARNSGNANASSIYGIYGEAANDGSGTVTSAFGMQFTVRNTGGGTLTNAYGQDAGVANTGAGTITNAYGIHIATPSNPSGTITNIWGLKIEAQRDYAIQTGTGLVDFGGKTQAPAFQATGTKFTASGCTNGTTVGGATAGKFTSGDSGGSCSITVTMGSSAAAANGWACTIQDLSSPAKIWGQTASNTTTATFLSPGVTTSTDVVSFHCIGF